MRPTAIGKNKCRGNLNLRCVFTRTTQPSTSWECSSQVLILNRPKKEREGTIRILIADDHPIVRYTLKELLALESDFKIVGEAADGREVLDKVRQIDPDILLLDIRMPNLNGLAILEALQETNSRTRVIVLTASDDTDVLAPKVKQLGGCGVLSKNGDADLIVESIRKVNAGQAWLD